MKRDTEAERGEGEYPDAFYGLLAWMCVVKAASTCVVFVQAALFPSIYIMLELLRD